MKDCGMLGRLAQKVVQIVIYVNNIYAAIISDRKSHEKIIIK